MRMFLYFEESNKTRIKTLSILLLYLFVLFRSLLEL